MQQRKPNHNSSVEFKQAFVNKDYVDHLYEIFHEFCNEKVKIQSYGDKRNNKEYKYAKFNTRSLKCFNYYRELFYHNREKRIPQNIKDLLTPVSLAYWAMDDGTAERNGFKLCTDSFLKDEVIILMEVLKDKFSLGCTLREHNSNQYRIYIRVSSMDKFRSLVKPHFHSSMKYKLEKSSAGAEKGRDFSIKRFYTTQALVPQFSEKWLCGFIQARGQFYITYKLKKSTGVLIRPKPIFVLTQDISEEKLIKGLQKFLGVGYITKNKTDVSFYITSLSGLNNILFPILDKNPLKYGKLEAYSIFKNIVEEMLNKNHLNLDGLLRIISASFKLNIDTGRRTKESKDNLIKFLELKHGITLALEELVKSQSNCNDTYSSQDGITYSPLTLDFIAGLIDGDGSFNVTFQIKPYRRVKVNFTVVQETSCKKLLHELKSYFSCGAVYDLPSASGRESRYVYKLDDINLILYYLAPVLNKIIFNTKKNNQDYKIMIKVCEILKLKDYKGLTDEIFIKVIELAYDKSKLGKNRTISKEKLIQKVKNWGGESSNSNKLIYKKNPSSLKKISGLNVQKRGLTSCSLYNIKLNPNFVSGFVDAEGCFSIGISRDERRTVGFNILPEFCIQLHEKDLVLLKQIQSFYGVGGINFQSKRKAVTYKVRSIEVLINSIIPHFEKYPLLTQKQGDFVLFKSVVELMKRKEHLTDEGFRKLLTIKASMNKGVTGTFKENYPDIVAVERPKVIPATIDGNWLAGFTSGDGSFMATVYKSPTSKLGKSVQLKFQLTQHEKDQVLLALIVKYLNCGSLQTSRNSKDLQVTSFKDIYNKIIPFFFNIPF